MLSFFLSRKANWKLGASQRTLSGYNFFLKNEGFLVNPMLKKITNHKRSKKVKKIVSCFFCVFPHDGNFQAIDSTRVTSPFLCCSHSDLFHIGAVTIPMSSMMMMSVRQRLLLGGCKRRLVLWLNQTMHKWMCLKRKETGNQWLMSMLRWTSLKSQRNPERYICKIFRNIFIYLTSPFGGFQWW